jgi:DNA-binding transcriptional LysR family regulator
MNLDALRVLDAIARRGSFAAAAEELDRAPSAVSYSIQRLEEETGVLLFDRSGRKAHLTAAGELMLEQGRHLLEQAETLKERARALETGWETRITLALDAIYPVPLLWPLVRRFTEQAPSTSLRIISEVLGGPWDALEQGRAELAVAPLQMRPPAGTRSKTIGSVRFIYVAHADHPACREKALTPERLARYRAIAVADTARSRPPRTTRLLDNQPSLTVSDFHAKISALEAGLGIGTLPEGMAGPLIGAGRLQQLDMADPAEAIPVKLAWRTDSAGKALRWLTRHLPDTLGDA